MGTVLIGIGVSFGIAGILLITMLVSLTVFELYQTRPGKRKRK